MKKRRSVDLRQQALSSLGSGMSRSQVCLVLGIHRTTLREWQLRQEQGSLEDRRSPGRPRKIKREHEAALLVQLQATPDATLEEHASGWAKAGEQHLSRATMARAITRVGWTRKKRA